MTGGRPRRRPCEFRCPTVVWGLTFLEAVVVFLFIAALLVLLAGQIESLRRRLRQDLADRQLAVLHEALVVYFLNNGEFPPGRTDLSATDAWHALCTSSAAGLLFADWPYPIGHRTQQPIDAWGRPYRYLSLEHDPRGRVVSNGNWPIFISAGPDGDFGDTDASAEADNRRTNEPR